MQKSTLVVLQGLCCYQVLVWLSSAGVVIYISIACVVIECWCGYILSMQKSTLALLVWLSSACVVID